MEEYDVVVVGAGPAGYLSALRMARLGAKVLLLDKDRVGGECLNYACIPSKTILSYLSSLEYTAKVSGEDTLPIDLDRLRFFRDSVVDSLVRGVMHLLRRAGVKYVNDTVIEIVDGKVYTAGGEAYKSNYVVLATGSSPKKLPNIDFDGKYVWNSRHALNLPRDIKSLCVVGGGAAGLEIASIYRMMGAEVHVVELMDRVAPFMDWEVSKRLVSLMSRYGVEFHLGTSVSEMNLDGGALDIRLGDGSKLRCDAMVLTIGRRPNIDIGGDVPDLELADGGFVKVDEWMRTNIDYIYAVGDVAGPPLLAHKAYWDAIVLSEYLYGDRDICRPNNIPMVIYSHPGALSIGLTEDQARDKDMNINVYKFPLSALGITHARSGDRGFVKAVCSSDGRIIGIHAVSIDISKLLGVAAVAVELGLKIEELGSVMFPHPSYSEAFWELAGVALGRGIHIH